MDEKDNNELIYVDELLKKFKTIIRNSIKKKIFILCNIYIYSSLKLKL